MVCEVLQELQWNFIQARAGSLNIDSLEWTNREVSCLYANGITSRRGTRANAAPKIKITFREERSVLHPRMAAGSMEHRCKSKHQP
jgi:hypothetical protein